MGRIHPLPLPHLVEATQMFLLYKSVEENMTAKMKSRITERQEKGLGPISFKRLLMAGGAGVMSAMILTKMIGFFPGCAGAVFITGPLSQALQVGPEDATFHADAIYEVEWEDEVDDLPPQTLIYRGGFAGLGRAGLAVVDNPFFGSGNGHTADKE
jgi:hypothetical protein